MTSNWIIHESRYVLLACPARECRQDWRKIRGGSEGKRCSTRSHSASATPPLHFCSGNPARKEHMQVKSEEITRLTGFPLTFVRNSWRFSNAEMTSSIIGPTSSFNLKQTLVFEWDHNFRCFSSSLTSALLLGRSWLEFSEKARKTTFRCFANEAALRCLPSHSPADNRVFTDNHVKTSLSLNSIILRSWSGGQWCSSPLLFAVKLLSDRS